MRKCAARAGAAVFAAVFAGAILTLVLGLFFPQLL